jgi:hypothetical protein
MRIYIGKDKAEVIINKEEVGAIIDNLTLLSQVDGCLQPSADKLYVELNKMYKSLGDFYTEDEIEEKEIMLGKTVLKYST